MSKAVLLQLSLVLLLPGQAAVDELSESAKTLAMQQQFDQAAVVWDKALKTAPEHFASLFNFGYMRYSQGRFSEAEPLLGRAARVRPGDFNVHYVLGLTLLKLDRREEALREWKAALELQPNNVKLMSVMAVEYGNGKYFRDACELAKRAVALEPKSASFHLIAVKACQDAADPSVFDLARRAAELFPDSARANFEYGFQLHRSGKVEASVPHIQKAIALDKDYEEPYFLYGQILLAREQFNEAASHFRNALRIRRDFVAACVSLAKALASGGQEPDAVRELRDCIRANPSHPQPHLTLSQIYFRLGDEAAAQAEKDISLRLRRANPETMESQQGRPFPDVVPTRVKNMQLSGK